MIESIGQVMLYVQDQRSIADFWVNQVGFVKVGETSNGHGGFSIEIAPREGTDTSFVLHNRALIEKLQPELNLGTPSILFSSFDLETTYNDFKKKNITVGDLVEMEGMKVFNFADIEGNYFAIREI
ncbi:VOC family protein [Carnobacterium gallinarum]|uniref:VOC family protein n=1 Tax=Carnobacterium gallinarum TaxID=2749 RepID=UPI0005520581|nr:VOC family protein [Carnobacterium gallinarum]